MVAPRLCVCKGDLFDYLIREYFVWTGVGVVRREVLGTSIRFPEDQMFGEEWLFYLRVARACRAGFVDESLSVYHYQRGSLSRTDKRRNALCYRGLLRAIHDTFDDMTRGQRRAVRWNLGLLGRQLGYKAYRTGRYSEAFRHLAESFRYEPGARTLYHMFQAAAWRLLTGDTDPEGHKPGVQDLSEVVR